MELIPSGPLISNWSGPVTSRENFRTCPCEVDTRFDEAIPEVVEAMVAVESALSQESDTRVK
jgi:hypothetical protein